MPNKFIASMAVIFSMSASVSAHAQTYSNSAAFSSATYAGTTADFNALSTAFYGGPGYGVGTVQYNGVTVSTATDYLYSQGTNAYGTGTFLSAQQFSPTVVNLSFATPSTALGFNYVSGTPLVLTIAGQTYNIGASAFPKLGFFGVTSNVAFTSAVLSTAGGGIDLDNITFASASPTSAVPEPANWAMMIVGFGAVGGAMRRRRTTATLKTPCDRKTGRQLQRRLAESAS